MNQPNDDCKESLSVCEVQPPAFSHGLSSSGEMHFFLDCMRLSEEHESSAAGGSFFVRRPSEAAAVLSSTSIW